MGIVHYRTRSEALQAIRSLHDCFVDDRPLLVREDWKVHTS